MNVELTTEKINKSIKDRINEYLSIRNGDRQSKRKVLKTLIDDVDTFCKSKTNIESIKKAKHFYQCVRHPIDDPLKEFPFYYNSEEEWLDFIFHIVIDILSFMDLEKRAKIIVEEENKK